ncbi:MAG: hypothetical protein ABR537_08570 [Gemmatimonadales bacterium]
MEGFTPFIGFPELTRAYHATRLFPFFEQRVMDSRRPDFPEYVTALGLSRTAGEIELLARSSGNRIGDTVRVSLEPVIGDDGHCRYDFPVHGVRHVPDGERAGAVVRRLRVGQRLSLRAEPANPVNARALQVATEDGEIALGWVPDLLLDFVHLLRESEPIVVTVLQVNREDQPKHLGLLVQIEGEGPPGYRGFSGPRWNPIDPARLGGATNR